MADEQHSPPGVFGIETGFRKLTEHLDRQHREILAALCRFGGSMADQFDNLRELLNQQSDLITSEAGEVKVKLDENAALIQQLKDQIAAGGQVPADVLEKVAANNEAVRAIFAAPTARR